MKGYDVIDPNLYYVDHAGDISCKTADKWLVIDGSYNANLGKMSGVWLGHGHVMHNSQTKIFMLYQEGI